MAADLALLPSPVSHVGPSSTTRLVVSRFDQLQAAVAPAAQGHCVIVELAIARVEGSSKDRTGAVVGSTVGPAKSGPDDLERLTIAFLLGLASGLGGTFERRSARVYALAPGL